ncbi:hypothetical protein THAOC_24351, partial [Thalassiosira oceanica]
MRGGRLPGRRGGWRGPFALRGRPHAAVGMRSEHGGGGRDGPQILQARRRSWEEPARATGNEAGGPAGFAPCGAETRTPSLLSRFAGRGSLSQNVGGGAEVAAVATQRSPQHFAPCGAHPRRRAAWLGAPECNNQQLTPDWSGSNGG